jgi:peptide-methionine (R)-S-oxide reductase
MNFPVRLFSTLVAGLIALGSWTALAVDEKKSTSGSPKSSETETGSQEKPYVPKSKRALQRSLTRMQFDVTQNESTEPAFRNKYWNNKKDGTYQCIVCDRGLFSSDTKFKSGTGWPSFYAPLDDKKIGTREDYRLFYTRTEVHCSRCKAHLGHVFDDGPQPTGLRYCMNSASLKFVQRSKDKDDEKSD